MEKHRQSTNEYIDNKEDKRDADTKEYKDRKGNVERTMDFAVPVPWATEESNALVVLPKVIVEEPNPDRET
nr:hypothetical protein [Sicyoidochytrium minutum DNA virus]